MSKILVIVESPAKCTKINNFLGNNYIVKASFGHFRDLAKGLGAININNNFKPTYQITKNKIVRELRDCAKKCSEVVIASDLDREGEAIGWHVAYILKLNPSGYFPKHRDLRHTNFNNFRLIFPSGFSASRRNV